MRTIAHLKGIMVDGAEVCVICPPDGDGEFMPWGEAHEDIGEMNWRRWDGTTGEYHGRLLDLGYGIPRKAGPWGIRRALFDLALGYVSGFPVRDIIPFSLRSLFPSRVIDAEVVEEDEP